MSERERDCSAQEWALLSWPLKAGEVNGRLALDIWGRVRRKFLGREEQVRIRDHQDLRDYLLIIEKCWKFAPAPVQKSPFILLKLDLVSKSPGIWIKGE